MPINHQHDEAGLTENEADCSRILPESFAKFDRDTLSLKTRQISLWQTVDGISTEFCQNWPQWGSMQNGECCGHPTLAPRITAPGCIWLLTPAASIFKRFTCLKDGGMFERRLTRGPGCLSEQLYRLGARGDLSPTFIEWLMGYPQNYTDLLP